MTHFAIHDCTISRTSTGWEITRPTIMGIETIPCDSFRDAMDYYKDYESRKAFIDTQRKKTNEYCAKNKWTYSGT